MTTPHAPAPSATGPLQRLGALARRVIEGVAIVLFGLMVCMVLAQVIARKLFDPLVWSEELARYLFIWVMFLGWFIATDRGSHIAIDLVRKRARGGARFALDLLAGLATCVLMIWLIGYGLRLVYNNYDVETVTLFFSFAVVYAIVPIAALAILLRTLAQLQRDWRRWRQPAPESPAS